MRFARGAPWAFIGANAAAVAAVLAIVALFVPAQGPWGGAPAYYTLLTVGLLGVGWVVLLAGFFRDPDRAVGPGVVAPADGRVTRVSLVEGRARLTTVLGVFNVHVVRSPVEGRLVRAAHRKGAKRLAASKDAAENERLEMQFEASGAAAGATVRLTLIAGAFADRIVAYVEEGQQVAKGERVGIIKFGSRVDLEYAGGPSVSLAVREGGTVKAAKDAVLLPATEEGTA